MTPTVYVINTHALLWFLAGMAQLGINARAILQNPASRLILPVTALAEACWIVGRGKIPLNVADALAALDADARITVYPMDRALVEICNGLTAVGEMHDRQIVATALAIAAQGETVALLTKDENITASGAVAVVW